MTCNHYNDILLADNDIYVAACGHAEVIKSTDQGISWSFCSTGLPDFEVYKLGAAPGILIAASMPSIYLSFDHGLSWKQGGAGLPQTHYDLGTEIRDFANDGPLLFACTDNRVFYSTDSGFQWVDITPGLPPLSILWGGTLMVRDHFIYYGTNGFGIWKRSTLNLPWGMVENDPSVRFTVYPNPAREWIDILPERKQSFGLFEIMGLSGDVLMSGHYDGSEINIANLLPGLYFLRLKSAAGDWTHLRFIKID